MTIMDVDAFSKKHWVKALGRSIFVKFIDDILNEGREAIMSLQEELEDEQSTDEI